MRSLKANRRLETTFASASRRAPESIRRKVNAAAWFYLEEAGWRETLEIVNSAEPAIDRAELDRWLSSAPVVRSVCFDHLYLSNDQLTWAMLGRKGRLDTSELDR